MPLGCQNRKFLPNWKGWLLKSSPPGALLEGVEAWLGDGSWGTHSSFTQAEAEPGTRGLRK